MKGSKTLLSYFLFMIGLQWKAVYAIASTGCEDSEFMCMNKECISPNWKCDGEDDCGDNSDELDCKFTRHKECSGFRCSNQKCVPSSWTCDKADDCGDGSDEASDVYPFCLRTDKCPDNSFKCVKGGQCIRRSFRCDGVKNCDDGSDEEKCASHTCAENEMQCKNKKCISEEWVCDRNNDCGDGSDETNCRITNCTATEFQCLTSKHCIRAAYKCDGEDDCIDRSDEIGCETKTSTPKITTTTTTTTTKSLSTLKENSETEKSTKKLSTIFETTTTTTPGPCKSLIYYTCPSNKQCIHKSWLCDGAADCPNGEDESDAVCHSTTCQDDEFRCHNGKCIDAQKRCNENDDCPDGSDEKNCTAIKISCTKETYHCKNVNDTCLHHTQVCDRKKDCKFGDDESDLCGIDECTLGTHECSGGDSNCEDLPHGYKCKCDRGYRLAPDQKTCIDIDECKLPGTCTQGCINYKGSFACVCNLGYSLDSVGKRICRADAPVPYLIFSNSYDIREVSTNAQHYDTIVKSTRDASAISLDVKNNMIYWIDISNKTINRVARGSPNVEYIVTGLNKPESLAVDWVGQKLYWTESSANGKLNRISVSTLEGKHKKSFVNGTLEENFRAVAVYPDKGFIYWTDWGAKPKIQRANLDGSNKITVVNEDFVTEAISITIDNTLERIFWTDLKRRHICSAELDGSDIKIVIHGLSSPYGLAVFEEFVYWTDWFMQSLNKANKFDGTKRTEVKKWLFRPKGVAVFHPLAQKQIAHPCQEKNGNCSHLCFVSPNAKNKYVCQCPDFMILDNTGKNCMKSPTAPPPISCPAYSCRSSTRCISNTLVCNGHKDCPYNDDEENCIEGVTDEQAGMSSITYLYIALPCLLIILIIVVLVLVYRRKRSRFDLRMVYETQTEALHHKDKDSDEVEVKYVTQQPKHNSHKQNNKNFENINFRAMDDEASMPLQMSDVVEGDCMVDSSDNSSGDIDFDDTRPII